MAFYLDDVYGFGTGKLQDISVADGTTDKFNSYARVEEIGDSFIRINTDTQVLGSYEDFSAGNDILIHVSASLSPTAKLGKYLVARITLKERDILHLDKNFADILTNAELDYYFVQAITFANCDCLHLLQGGIVTAPPFNPYHFHGGILCLKCWDTLDLQGGHISLSDSGIPVTRRNTLRPALPDEPVNDNSRLLLNAGDGAAFICTNNISFSDNSKIGNTLNLNDNPDTSSDGGGSLILAARNVAGFDNKRIALKRTGAVGKGKASLYFANRLGNDLISDKFYLREVLGLKSFGKGLYSANNPTFKFSNFANVTIRADDDCLLGYKDKSVRGLAALQKGATCILLNKSDFRFATVLHDDGKFFRTDKPFPAQQIISVAQFDNLTLAKFNQSYFCVQATGTVDLSGAIIIADYFFLAANTLVTSESTRIYANKIFIAADHAQTFQQNFQTDDFFIYTRR